MTHPPSIERGCSLPREYYTSEALFRRDLDQVFFRDWLYVGHVSQIPRAGDFLTFEVAQENILITRDEHNQIRAFYNVCRHRGARIAGDPCGSARQLRCPYHNWTYTLDGHLKSAPGMSSQIEKGDFGLRPVWLDVWQGLIYVNLSEAESTQTVAQRLQAANQAVADHHFGSLKIAKTMVYDVPANWKLIMENYRECYHCRSAHPEFCATVPVSDLDAHRGQADTRLVKEPFGTFTQYSLRAGAVSQSVSGEAVSLPLGAAIADPRLLRALTLYPAHAFVFGGDYGFAFGLNPQSATRTLLTAHWYVNDQAVEGVDYHADSVAAFWDITTRQDIYLCTINQQGVNSRGYVPGPLHLGQEDDVAHFHDYYAKKLEA